MNHLIRIHLKWLFTKRSIKDLSFSLLLSFAVSSILFVGCKNSSSGGNSQTADTSMAGSSPVETPGAMDEAQNTEIDEAMNAPGSRLNFTEAGYFLSRMTYGLREFGDYNDTSVTKNIKYVSNPGIPIGIQEMAPIEYSRDKAAPLIEGFGALKSAFITTYFSNQVDWTDTRIDEAVASLSGLDLRQTTDRPQAFMYINPDAIRWCWNNFYRPPSAESITDISLNALYNIVFQKFVHTLIIAHEQVATFEFENEQSWYKNSIIIEEKYAPELLSVRYKVPEKYSPNEFNPNYFPSAAGFWIRRSIDGTEGLLWKYLKIIATDYDSDWACRNFKICAPVNNNDPVPATADFKTFSESFDVYRFPFNVKETPLFSEGEESAVFREMALKNIRKFINPEATESKGYYTGYAFFEKEYTALLYFYNYSSITGGDNSHTTVDIQTYTPEGKLISKLSLGEKYTMVNSSAQRVSQDIEGYVYADKVSKIEYKTFLEDKLTGSEKPMVFQIQPDGKIVPM
ncbi:MAG TPA: hypothetical protein VMV47_17425 [Bacteroidales bacterium]|nr:hypothetical protein [Bacteroidales bacterium]